MFPRRKSVSRKGGAVPCRTESARLAAVDELPNLAGARRPRGACRGFAFDENGERFKTSYSSHKERTRCETSELIAQGKWSEAKQSLVAWMNVQTDVISGNELRTYSKFKSQIDNKSSDPSTLYWA